VSRDSSPALIIRFPSDTTAANRDRLVALLADYDLVAIQEDDPATPKVWTAHFRSANARDRAAAAIRELADIAAPRLEFADIEDDDWARRTQADLPAIRIGRIVVAPPWDTPPHQSSGDVIVEIEPSCGFGTGHHQSTRLCLVLLQNQQLNGRTAIDAGTGSGVLAIAAAKLGAGFVAAFDSDPDAIENARENIVRNGVERAVEAHVRDLSDPSLAPADVVTANLTGTLLARHARDLAALVRPSGSLIVAGFTIDEKPQVIGAFEETFALSEAAEEDDWWALALTLQLPASARA
jgi:ribosomal protein L11 methyltransferase